jgi:hypothetical protein
VLPFQSLPQPIVAGLTQVQRDALAFSVRTFKVVAARVQSFQTGATSGGTIVVGGLSHSLGSNWGAFGGVGTINLGAVNQFKTDVQFKLRDESTGEDAFIARSLPFAMTLSVDPGDTIDIYFARGGLPKLYAPGDFTLGAWTPFAAKSLNTGQIVPFSPIPGLMRPKAPLAGPIITLIFGLFFLSLGVVGDIPTIAFLSAVPTFIGGLLITLRAMSRSNYKRDLAFAIHQRMAVLL